MASLGLIESLLGGLEPATKRVFLEVARAWVPNLRFGAVDHQVKAENFNGFTVTSTTAASTGEFTVEHGLGRTPYRLMPAIDLTAIGSAIVPLEVTRAADARRLYLKSPTTNAVFSCYVE